MYQQEARQHQEAAQQVEQLRDELEQLKAQLARPESWRTTMSSAVKLNELEPEEGLNLIQMAWAEASGDSYARQQMLKAAFVARHPLLVRVMDLGMRDPSPEVQEWAITYLRQTALRDFALSFREYEAWYAKSKDLTLEEIVRRGVEEMAETLQATHAGERAKLFVRDGRGAMLASSPAAAAIAAEYDIHELIIPALEPSAGRDVIRTISDTLAEMSLGEPFVRARILPLLDSENHDIANAAIEIVASQKAAYAVDTLVELLTERYYSTDQAAIALHDVADALGEIGDPRVIPIMIALIDGDDTYRTIYGIGYAGLADLTGVRYDESHDGEWWRQWWEDNRARYPGLDDAEIPELKPKQGAESNPQRSAKPRTDRRVAPVDQQPLEPETPEQSLLAGGTPEMRYFLYGPKSHQIDGAHPLLLVLPGGDGSANFKPFVSNIWRQTSPPDMLVAQLVAPRWSPDQFDSVVWPTIGTAWEDAEFTTEQFIETVVDDIDARYDVDRSRVWILAWSSGGPAAYASLMDGPATGAFIAMSVFKGDQLGDLSRVAGKDVYILHSPTDFIPMQFPEAARDKLGENGATTKLQTYSGGHGWHGDVFGMIREGLVWLQQHAGD
jgi:poly(3-hydroxybutyrate) depolymerase